MTIYLINIGLILFWSVLLLKTNISNDKTKKLYCAIVAVQWIFISGFRDWSVGADTWNYYRKFQDIKDVPWKTIVSNCWNYLFNELEVKDPGYDFLQKAFQIFSSDYQMWLVFIAIVFTGLMARWIYKYSSMPEISFLIYSVLFYAFFSITGHRQTLATALIFFLGYEYAKKREFLKFVIVAFIAFMLHKSSIIFIIYFIIANISISSIYVLCVLVVIAGAGFLGKQLYAPIALLMGFSEEQINYDGSSATTYATVLLLLCVIALCMYPWIKKQRVDNKNLYNMLFLTMGSTVLLFHQQGFMRIQQYFSLVIMIVVPEMIKVVDKNYRLLVYIFIVVFLIGYLVMLQPKYSFYFM
jgi:transmembrane protein EpsG